jgi:hypothetical protein
MVTVPRLRAALGAVATTLVLVACQTPEPLGPSGSLADLITFVSARNSAVQGTLQPGVQPSGTAGPTVELAGISSAVNGGSSKVSLSGSDTFQRVTIGIEGVEGWYDLRLPSGASLEDVVLGVSPQVGANQLRMRYTVEGVNGLGPFAAQTVRIVRVGTGDVQINVAWSGASDVDLSVEDPSGFILYYGAKRSDSGGSLDLDSNAACNIDGKNAENVVWPTNVAPSGPYKVTVRYFDDCGVARSDWVVTVQLRGQAPQTFTGSFVGTALNNAPAQIGTFTF